MSEIKGLFDGVTDRFERGRIHAEIDKIKQESRDARGGKLVGDDRAAVEQILDLCIAATKLLRRGDPDNIFYAIKETLLLFRTAAVESSFTYSLRRRPAWQQDRGRFGLWGITREMIELGVQDMMTDGSLPSYATWIFPDFVTRRQMLGLGWPERWGTEVWVKDQLGPGAEREGLLMALLAYRRAGNALSPISTVVEDQGILWKRFFDGPHGDGTQQQFSAAWGVWCANIELRAME